MTNRPFRTVYVGVTNDLQRRAQEHGSGTGSAFARRYHLTRLVFAEFHDEIRNAIARETRDKHWPRLWKLNVIEPQKPLWEDVLERWSH